MTKQCTKCKQELPLTEFNKRQASKDGLQHKCRSCASAMKRDWRARTGDPNKKDAQVKHKFGISLEEYNDYMKDGKCLICNTTEGRMVLDHCHTTGKIRGCLCSNCNTAIGLMHDNVDKLEAAIKYLKEHSYA
ncbi:hypothetical protein [Vibrio phage PJN101]|nr:hypothetical protein [Vibrio phage PJN101]